MVKIKICGLTRLQDIDAVNEYLPDYAGFVFAKSRRRVSAEETRSLVRELSPSITAVGLFVNETLDNVLETVEKTGVHVIQLHGDETDEYIRRLRKRTDCEIWRAVRVREHVDEISGAADRYLFDAYVDGYGGGGKVFNHEYLDKIDMSSHLLAGGLNADNIAAAARKVKPYAVDVSSGVETDGVKDRAKIRELIKIIKHIQKGY